MDLLKNFDKVSKTMWVFKRHANHSWARSKTHQRYDHESTATKLINEIPPIALTHITLLE